MPSVMWMRDADNPILPVIPGTWRHSRVANCSLVIHGDTAYLYYRAGSRRLVAGVDRARSDRRGVLSTAGVRW